MTVESIVSAHQPGDRIQVEYRHPDGATGTGVMTLGEDPTMEIVALESQGGRITPAQQAFRAAWLNSRQAGR